MCEVLWSKKNHECATRLRNGHSSSVNSDVTVRISHYFPSSWRRIFLTHELVATRRTAVMTLVELKRKSCLRCRQIVNHVIHESCPFLSTASGTHQNNPTSTSTCRRELVRSENEALRVRLVYRTNRQYRFVTLADPKIVRGRSNRKHRSFKKRLS